MFAGHCYFRDMMSVPSRASYVGQTRSDSVRTLSQGRCDGNREVLQLHRTCGTQMHLPVHQWV